MDDVFPERHRGAVVARILREELVRQLPGGVPNHEPSGPRVAVVGGVDHQTPPVRLPRKEERHASLDGARLSESVEADVLELQLVLVLDQDEQTLSVGLPLAVQRNAALDLEELHLADAVGVNDVELGLARVFVVAVGHLEARQPRPRGVPRGPGPRLGRERRLAPQHERVVAYGQRQLDVALAARVDQMELPIDSHIGEPSAGGVVHVQIAAIRRIAPTECSANAPIVANQAASGVALRAMTAFRSEATSASSSAFTDAARSSPLARKA